MIRVEAKRDPESKYTRGRVEVDGVDISSHVQEFNVRVSAMNDSRLYLDIVLGKSNDELDCEFPEGEATVRARVIYRGVEMWADVVEPKQVEALLKALAA